jgi:hypothetical protein
MIKYWKNIFFKRINKIYTFYFIVLYLKLICDVKNVVNHQFIVRVFLYYLIIIDSSTNMKIFIMLIIINSRIDMKIIIVLIIIDSRINMKIIIDISTNMKIIIDSSTNTKIIIVLIIDFSTNMKIIIELIQSQIFIRIVEHCDSSRDRFVYLCQTRDILLCA